MRIPCIFLTVVLFTWIVPLFGDTGLTSPIANAGFEDASFAGWGWYARARAIYLSDTKNPHSGNRCVVFTNESPLAPEVYGRLYQGAPVLPGIEYELSAWVRGEEVASGIHFTDWNSYTLNVPEGTYDWRRIFTRFKTKEDQNGLNLGINVVNTCKALGVDDIELRPVGIPFRGMGFSASLIVQGRIIGDRTEAPLVIAIHTCALSNATIEATIRSGDTVLFQEKERLKRGKRTLEWKWNSGDVEERTLECCVRVTNDLGILICSASKKIEKLGSNLSKELNNLETRLKELDVLIDKCKSKGIAVDYPMTAKTLLGQFIPLAREDIQKNEMARADFAIRDMTQSLNEAFFHLNEYLRDPSQAPNFQRYVTSKTSPLSIEGTSFIGDRNDSRGQSGRGPVFFCGYGHFGQVQKDIPLFPDYGVNIIQIEIGPSAVLISENEVTLERVEAYEKVLDEAAKHNVAVNILLSPHYFPQWAFNKWSHLSKGGGGFLGYCVDAPEAKQVIEKFLRIVIPHFQGKPALHSLCLSNEPIFDRAAGCDNTKNMWKEYLARIHGNIGNLNKAYGADYKSFEDVSIPGNDHYNAPQFYDYCIFNQERFSGWHKWMAEIIHEMAPEIPVHAKAMSLALSWRHSIAWGVDPEMFGELSQINGNDCWIAPVPNRTEEGWAMDWHLHNMSYDLQRSLFLKPIFNSENHPTIDRSTYYVPPEHFRAVLWQGAIHGESATTIWVWERTFDRNYDFYGNVMDRPGCAQEVGRTCLDLNRFADEVTALQNVKAPVAILFSIASVARDSAYLGSVRKTYEALNFCGVKIDFISEKQIASGKGDYYKMIIFPSSDHVKKSTFDAAGNLADKKRLVLLGDCLGMDSYGCPFPEEKISRIKSKALILDAAATDTQKIGFILRKELEALEALPEISVIDVSKNVPVWGVEWLPVQIKDKTYVNMVNLLGKPIEIEIRCKGKVRGAVNLLSLGGVANVGKLEPLVPVLARIKDE
ncbi:beta-galactosidase [Candidatus Sumerlaeota bacterium]|nr:beta-galactosidase [Candidatus Sumerlaeota bacterium]